MAKQEERKKLLEREYIFHIRKEISKVPSYRKTEKAVTAVREFLMRHMKIYDKDKDKIKLSKWLNEYLWKRGIKNPPVKVKIRAVKFSDGIVEAELVEMPKKAEIEKAKERTRKEEAAKIEAQKAEEAKKTEESEKEEKTEEEKAKEEQVEKLKEEERLLGKELEARKQQKEIIKPVKEVHKKTMMGV